MNLTLSRLAAFVAPAILATGLASAQTPKISDEVVKIGVLTDASELRAPGVSPAAPLKAPQVKKAPARKAKTPQAVP